MTYTKNKKTGKEYMIGKGLLDKILETGPDGGVEWVCQDVEKVGPMAHKVRTRSYPSTSLSLSLSLSLFMH